MQVIKVINPVEGAQEAFKIIEDSLKNNELNIFGLATGSTPVPLYDLLKSSTLDFSDKISINLDEYVGLGAEDKQSYRYFMNEQLFNEKPFKKSYVPNGLATDAAAECQRYDHIIEENPIDIQILGLGQNGHIGFNEPGTSFDSLTHEVRLTESTIEANKRFFEKIEDVPTHAYSMGIASIMKGKKIIIMAYGEAKAEAVKAMIEGPITEDLPASVLQNHLDVTVIVDEAAANLL